MSPYIPGMPKSRVPSPKDVVKVRRDVPPLPKPGDKILVEHEVLRVDPNGVVETVTLDVPGYIGGRTTSTWSRLAEKVKR